MSSDEQDALDALEKEASDFIKVCESCPSHNWRQTDICYDVGCGNRSHSKGFSIRCVSIILFLLFLDTFYAFYGLPTDNFAIRYAVLDLQPGVPESDIKLQYRKNPFSFTLTKQKTLLPQMPLTGSRRLRRLYWMRRPARIWMNVSLMRDGS